MKYNPHGPDWHKVPPPDIGLREYADAWIDMAPHIDQLTALATKAKVIVEFGVRGGVSTWAMLRGLPADGVLYGVDIEDVTHKLPVPVLGDERFQLLVGDSLAVGLPDHADMVMIDSSHEFAQTVAELMRAASLTPDVIVLHDYLYAECKGTVQQAVDGFTGTWYLQEPTYRLARVEPSRWGLAVLVPR